MTTTALPVEAALRRMATTDSTPVSSANISPLDSPRSSPSSTSLSSLASEDAAPQKQAFEKKQLVDTYGNPFEVPDYTIGDIHKAIPKHCFERSAATGLYYVARDVVSLAVTFYLFNRFLTPENVPYAPLRAGLWFLYTFVQGLFGTGLWVLAHECGHQSFSPSKVLNDTVGFLCHTSLLVPYFSWKISHGKHHKATGHMERDMVFVPKTKDEFCSRRSYLLHQLDELTEETPLATAVHLISQQLFGWPMYLFTNVTGHNKHEAQREGRGVGKHNGIGGGVNHFDPRSPLYEAKDAKLIALSDLGLLVVGSILYSIGKRYGFANLFVWYFAPYLWVNHWLVAITYLQHTDPSLPHYTPQTWTYTRGAAATIDREFGFIGRQLLHGIIETHVLHHYVSTIPFYHADEASEAIKKVMGRHYRSDVKDGPMGFIKSLWKSMRWCGWVEPMEGATDEQAGVLFFRNSNGLGLPPAKISKSSTS
ncbi:omega-6 fatty acid desaturase (delta-12 desaturase) [Cladophialophora yegresii CBS 114405]|uniref:Omega-6 fatty acid desaturase (Delta-12 desaturase) n=1 Tax=Cladophialophora yegresii CBS 114405 TaxID=1182544 RepID=W9VZM8_9EURO|nr:omega-6 fatty acid desaturase (delta-12 desaturase) [Cladophialophora yegresii CBS 114405]EXJ61138.1 omega-6 fatty acid desaturase (delta-12 desaturase) [Cladophialophora yegresii CBS 114405]